MRRRRSDQREVRPHGYPSSEEDARRSSDAGNRRTRDVLGPRYEGDARGHGCHGWRVRRARGGSGRVARPSRRLEGRPRGVAWAPRPDARRDRRDRITGNGTTAPGDVPAGAGAELGRTGPGAGGWVPRSSRPHTVRVGSSDLDRISLLLCTYLFQGLSPAELEPLARSAITRHAARGEYVHHVGDPADEIYLVAAGQLKDSIVPEEGDELVHTFYGPGMLIGAPGL